MFSRILFLFACQVVHVFSSSYGVTRTNGSAFYWGLAPYADMKVNKGDRVQFYSYSGFHDVALVPTAKELKKCDMTRKQILAAAGTEALNGTLVNGAYDITYTYNANYPGVYYFTCSVDDGGHCRAGQKFALTVLPTPSPLSVLHKVVIADEPFWTVAVKYDDLEIELGDTVSFPSDGEGYHNVAIVNPNTCPGYACCPDMGFNESRDLLQELYREEDYQKTPSYTWKPSSAGSYMVACTVHGGLHCQYGQTINIIVRPRPPTAISPVSLTRASVTSFARPFVRGPWRSKRARRRRFH